jgi:nitrogen fixation protein FixH
MVGIRHRILRYVVLLLVLAACAGKTPPEFMQAANGITATLVLTPYPPVPMETTTCVLTLTDAENQPVSAANVTFDLSMPAMAMPLNRPIATEAADGVYQAKAIFTMAGAWRIQVDVTHSGTRTTFTFDLKTK